MVSNIQIPEDCPVWLAMWISQSDQRLGNIEKTLQRLAYNNPHGKITFKWLVEKLIVPAGFVLAGYLIAQGG